MTFWVAGAIAVGAVVGAVGSNLAANKQASAQRHAADTQLGMFNTINDQEQPFMQAGYGATTREQELLGIGGDAKSAGYGSFAKPFTAKDYLANKDPGYEFQLKTGGQAIRNADTPGIGSLSGAALKDLMGFNQSMAATGYQNAFNRYTTNQNNTWARLSGLANTGQNAASNTGSAGTSLARGAGEAQAAAGGSQAAGILGATGAFSSGANSLAGMMYLNNGQNSGGSTGAWGTTAPAPSGGNFDGSVGGS